MLAIVLIFTNELIQQHAPLHHGPNTLAYHGDQQQQHDTEPNTIRKTITLIRHGQALHNVNGNSQTRDPPLTVLGISQARGVRLNEAALLVVSPLSRTIQTAIYAASRGGDCNGLQECISYLVHERKVKMVLLPHVQEVHAGKLPCDTGVSLSEIVKQFGSDLFVLDHVRENWYRPELDVKGRLKEFFKWIHGRSETEFRTMSLFHIDRVSYMSSQGLISEIVSHEPIWKMMEYQKYWCHYNKIDINNQQSENE